MAGDGVGVRRLEPGEIFDWGDGGRVIGPATIHVINGKLHGPLQKLALTKDGKLDLSAKRSKPAVQLGTDGGRLVWPDGSYASWGDAYFTDGKFDQVERGVLRVARFRCPPLHVGGGWAITAWRLAPGGDDAYRLELELATGESMLVAGSDEEVFELETGECLTEWLDWQVASEIEILVKHSNDWKYEELELVFDGSGQGLTIGL